MSGPALAPLLDGIDLVVFDKDGTLLDFEAMWGGWAAELGRRLEAATKRPVAGDVFAAIGFDPVSEHVRPGSPLAIATMGQLEEVVAAVIRRWCPNVAAARRAVETAWFEPDPVATAVPTADLGRLFEALVGDGRRIAVATTDVRAPTEATLRALGLRRFVSALACGDDGVGVKPDPAMVLAVCRALGAEPARTAVVGDTPADLAMGRSAGLGRVVGVLTGVGSREDLEPLADALLVSVGELLAS
ncbi:MAG TPA: HAD family hydrolase [Candidatus Limnocylindrales bacterium]|nr:HAD family hydrolase [Candidatus Limnocylindrales bacterium]